MTAETWTCVVCGETEAGAVLYEVCGGCGEPYHYNQTNVPAKDCGAAWVEDEDSGLVFFCNTCMDTARAEDLQRIESITAAAAAGAVTPEMLADLMQTLARTGMQPDQLLSGFPGLAAGMPGAPAVIPGIPAGIGGMSFPGPVSAADLGRMLGQPLAESAPAAAPPAREERDPGGPPPIAGRRSKPERRFRRIQ